VCAFVGERIYQQAEKVDQRLQDPVVSDPDSILSLEHLEPISQVESRTEEASKRVLRPVFPQRGSGSPCR
jgi:hypothetical protein